MITLYNFLRKRLAQYLLVVLLSFTCSMSFGVNPFQASNSSLKTILGDDKKAGFGDLWGKSDEKSINPLKKLSVSGFYRALIYTRTIEDAYTHANSPLRVVSVGDGYREPMLNLNVTGNPTNNTYFNYQMYFFPNYGGPTFDNRDLSLQFGATLSGGIKTKFGKYDVTLGGSNWQKLSQFTLWQNEGFNRFSTFDRRPWDESGVATSRYKEFNEQGTINQDVRWGKRPFQGVYIESTGMPKKLGLVFFYGKTDNNGGGLSYQNPMYPDQFVAGKLTKSFGKNSIGYNTFNRFSNASLKKDVFVGYDVHTAQYVYFFKNIKFSGEVGAGSFESPSHPKKYSECLNLNFFFPKKFTYLPLNVQLFQIGSNFVNLNTIVYNTSLPEAQKQSSSLANSQSIFPFESPVVEIGQLTSNRRGVNINTETKILKKIRLNIGYANAGEIEVKPWSNRLSYNHRVNALAITRLQPFVTNLGPYKRINTFFRGYYETVTLSDTVRKYFNTIEVQAKYGDKFFKKDFFCFYNGYFNSIQSSFSLINKFSDAAYIRTYSHEFDVYYNIIPKFTLVGYYGIERAIGNRKTDLNTINNTNDNKVSYLDKGKFGATPTLNPRNQTAQGIGLGFDIDLGKDVGLYYRHRWFTYKDANFPDDHYTGQEATLELKVTFY